MTTVLEDITDNVIVEHLLASFALRGDYLSLVRFGSTCRRFLGLSRHPDLWRHFDVSSRIADADRLHSTKPRLLSRAPQLAACEELSFEMPGRTLDSMYGIAALISAMRGLKRVRWSLHREWLAIGLESLDDARRSIAESLCSLRSLVRLGLRAGSALFESFRGLTLPPTLERLSIKYSSTAVPFVLEHAREIEGLKGLSLSVNDVDNEHLIPSIISDHFPHLQRLSLSLWHGPSAGVMGALLTRLTQLQRLRLVGPDPEMFGIPALAESDHAGALRSLALDHSNDDSFSLSFVRCVAMFTGLTELTLGPTTSAVEIGVGELASLKGLECLTIGIMPGAQPGAVARTEDDFAAFGDSPDCRSLRKLSIEIHRNGNDLPPVNLSRFFASRRCSALCELTIGGFLPFTAESAVTLATNAGDTLCSFSQDYWDGAQFVRPLIAMCPNLAAVEFHCDRRINESLLAILRPDNCQVRAPIKSFAVNYTVVLPTPRTIRVIAEALCGTLETLELLYHGHLNDHLVGLEELERCTKLKTLFCRVFNWSDTQNRGRPPSLPPAIGYKATSVHIRR